MVSGMIRLVLERAGLVPVVMTFSQSVVVVGRGTDDPDAPAPDWSLAFPEVSRQQCRFSRIADRIYVEGLSARTPTRVGGEVIAEITRIFPGDRVAFGGCVLRLAGEEGGGRAAGARGEEAIVGAGARPGVRIGEEAMVGARASPGGGAPGPAEVVAVQEDMSWVAEAARRWSALGQPAGLLLRGAELRRGLEWARAGEDLGAEGARVRRFVATSAAVRRASRQRALVWAAAALAAIVWGKVTAGSLLGPPSLAGSQRPGRASRGCVPEELARAEAATRAAEREDDATRGLLFAGLGLRIAEFGGCGETTRAEAVLRDALTASRGWAIGAQEGPVRALAAGPDGRLVAAADARGRVRVWDVLGGGEPALLAAGGEPATALRFSEDGRWLVAGGDAGELRVWEAGRAGLSGSGFVLAGHRAAITGLTSAGAALATGDARGELRLWDMAGWTGSEGGDLAGGAGRGLDGGAVAPGVGAALNELAFEAGGGRVFALAGGRVRSWRVEAGVPVPGAAWGGEAEVTSFALRPGAVVTGDRAGEVRVWRSGRGRWTSGPVTTHAAEVVRVRALAGRDAVASLGRDGELRLAELGAPLRRDGTPLVYGFTRPASEARELIVDASGDRALTVGAELWLWDLRDRRGDPVGLLDASGTVTAAVGGGAWATAAGAEGALRAWDLRGEGAGAQGYPLAEQGAGWRSLALAGGGSAVAVAGRDGGVRAWRVDGDGVPAPHATWSAGSVERLALSEDGRWLAGSSGEALRVWDLSAPEREPAQLSGHVRAIEALSFGGRDGWLVSADPGEVFAWRIAATGPEAPGLPAAPPAEVWALATSEEHVAVGTGAAEGARGRTYAWPLGEPWRPEALVAEHSRPVTALAFAPGGAELASGAADGGVRAAVWEEGRWRATRPYDHGQAIRALAFGAGEPAALAVGGGDGAVAVYSPRRGGDPLRFAAHAGAITGLVFGSGPSRLVSASAAGELALWQLGEGAEEVARIGHRRPIALLRGDRAGRLAVVADDDEAVRVWPLEASGLVRLACLVAGRDLSAEEWRRALPGSRAQPLCGGG